ncbi:MAG: MBOAT family protein [Bryobacter sp.]|nr:MBOAT family protein [Bryobacter sp.]
MLFNTVQFFVFFAIVLALFYSIPSWSLRKLLLLVASWIFYMAWNPKFILLLLTLTVIDYFAGIWIELYCGARRKAALLMSLVANLGFLGFFKYYNFLADNFALLLGQPEKSFFRNVVLPVGISVHTFQSICYVVDVYRREQEPIRNPVDYALFIAFFPQLVAGPIVRPRDFFRDLFHWNAPTIEDIQRGILQILVGLTKKMAFADQFAIVSDRYFASVQTNPGLLNAWSGTIAFGLQIYFDFSGYTDMAIGTAKVMGFHFPENFRRPYLAASITEFWRRWHISLSTWLRDYLYIPLGGNRGGSLMTYRNLMLTMLLGGLWHGASWNFVLWGGYHGLLLSIERMLGVDPEARWTWSRPFRMALVFVLAMLSWVPFRAQTFSDSLFVFRQMFAGAAGAWLLEPWQMGLAGLALLLALWEEKRNWFEAAVVGPRWAYAAAIAALLLCLEVFAVTELQIPFVYFQF